MKLWKQGLCVLLAGAMAFGLTACALPEDPDDETGGTPPEDVQQPEGSGAAALLDRAYAATTEEEFLSIDVSMTAKTDYGEVSNAAGFADWESTMEAAIRLINDVQNGFAMSAQTTIDGEPGSSSLYLDGVMYSGVTMGDEMLYAARPDVDEFEVIPYLLRNNANLFSGCDSLFSLAGLDSVDGWTMRVAEDGRQIDLEIGLKALCDSLLAWTQALKEQSLEELAAIGETLFDDDITVVDFLDRLDAVLAPNGFPLETLLSDENVALFAIMVFSNGIPPEEMLAQLFEDPARFLYETISESAGTQVGNILSEPQAGESVYDYVRRNFGQFKVTGLIDLFAGQEVGAEGFRAIRENIAALESKTAYDLADLIFQDITGAEFGLETLFRAVEFGTSSASCSVKLDASSRISEIAFGFDLAYTDADPDDGIEVFESDARFVLDGTLTVSYDTFTLTAPEKDQLAPEIGSAQLDETNGRIVIPVQWNGARYEDLWYVCEAGGVMYSEQYGDMGLSFEIPMEATEEGIVIDLSAFLLDWETTCAEIDDKFGCSEATSAQYEISMDWEYSLFYDGDLYIFMTGDRESVDVNGWHHNWYL